MGGGTHSNCSMLEAISMCENIAGQQLRYTYEEGNRKGDHMWWVSDVRRFRSDYPNWNYRYDIQKILEEIYESQMERKPASLKNRAVA